MTQVTLGQLIGKDSATISRWEKGEQLPEQESITQLSDRLQVPMDFFMKPLPEFDDSPLFFRSMASVTKSLRKKVQARLRWAQEISCILQEWVDLPEVIINNFDAESHNDITDSDIEKAAKECRDLWQIGNGPISSVLLAMENSGIVVIKDEFRASNMDGLSNWLNERPYVLIAKDKDNCVRTRMDAAHELGHLVLHRRIKPEALNKPSDFKEIERQAFYFAGAFLMPGETFAREVYSPSLDTFVALKERWKVSVGAMIKRSEALDIINESQATRLWKQYSARGWRRGEPLDDNKERLPVEAPVILHRSIDLLLQENVKNIDQLLGEIRLLPADIEALANLPKKYLTEKKADVIKLPTLKKIEPAKQEAGEVIPLKISKLT